jgi:hypothetical protein
MQIELQAFLALLAAHLVGDFPLQTARMVAGKVALDWTAFFRHGLVHLSLSIIALALFVPALLWQWSTAYALALLTIGHLALDWGKSNLVRSRPGRDGSLLFVSDQVAHVLIVAAASMIVVQDTPAFHVIRAMWLAQQDRVLIISTVMLAFVFPVGYLIRYLLSPLSDELTDFGDDPGESNETVEELTNAGLYIGWLERALLVIAFAVGSFMAVGLIVGAKSVVRFPKFQSRAFAEYFLIGTFISVGSAALGGWILISALSRLPAG